MTRQEQANQILALWQQQRQAGIPAKDRLCGDIGHMTHGILDNSMDLFEIWMEQPHRRLDFGAPERKDIEDAMQNLIALLLEIDGYRIDLREVSNG